MTKAQIKLLYAHADRLVVCSHPTYILVMVELATGDKTVAELDRVLMKVFPEINECNYQYAVNLFYRMKRMGIVDGRIEVTKRGRRERMVFLRHGYRGLAKRLRKAFKDPEAMAYLLSDSKE